MQCPSCNNTKSLKSETIVHHFKESGLDHITLNGVKKYSCKNCREIIYDFGDINQLNRLIAGALIRKKETLTNKEIRFLRTHVGYSSEMFARILGLDKTSFSRIENNRAKVSNQVNMAVRLAVAGKMADRNYDLHDLLLAIENDKLVSLKNSHFKAGSKGQWQHQTAS